MLLSQDESELSATVAAKLVELRSQRQLSLESLSKRSGVSRAMLWQIEQERSAPTLKVLSRVAQALQVPLTAFLTAESRPEAQVLRESDAKLLRSADGLHVSRALFPYAGSHALEFYQIRMDPGAHEQASAHAAGTFEHLVVHQGEVEISFADKHFALGSGDAMYFRADLAHAYRNTGNTSALLYLVMSAPAAKHYS